MDIHFNGYVDRTDFFLVPLFGTQVYVSWPQWEFQFFEIFRGDLRKKVGTSGTVDQTESCEAGNAHNACLRNSCQESRACVLEFPDLFAHTLLD